MKDLISQLVSMIGVLFLWVMVVWLFGGTCFAVLFAVYQERKIWKPKTLPSISVWGMLKVAMFNTLWSGFCALAAVLVATKYILTLGQSDFAREAHCLGERYVAHFCVRSIVGRVELRGVENLPSPNDDDDDQQQQQRIIPAPIYVANHASQIDVGAVYFLNRRFKWIAKESVFYIPGVGQIMALSQHIFIQRQGKNKKSVSNLFEKSGKAVMAGIPMFFFPQGTRWMADRLPFKDGAFIVAKNNQSALVPLSIDIPRNAWNSAYPFHWLFGSKAPVITITIHPAIQVKEDSTVEDLKSKCMDVIYTAVPTVLKAESPS